MKEIHIKAGTRATPKNDSSISTGVLNLALRAVLILTLGCAFIFKSEV